MRKFTIRSVTFDLSDDAALVLGAYAERLEFHVAKGRLSRERADLALDHLKRSLLADLSRGMDMTDSDARALVDRVEREYPFLPLAERPRGPIGAFFAGIAAIVAGLFRAVLLLVWLALKFLKTVLLAAAGLGSFGLAAVAALALAAFLVDPVVANQQLFAVLPSSTLWGLVAAEAGFLFFGFFCIFAIWTSPRLWRTFLVFAGACLLVAGNVFAYVGFETFYRYSARYEKTETVTLSASGAPVGGYGVWGIVEGSDFRRSAFRDHMVIPGGFVRVEYSGTGEAVEIRTVTSVGAPDRASADAYFAGLSPLAYVLSGSELTIDPKADGTPKGRVPYQGLMRDITIRFPERLKPKEETPAAIEPASDAEEINPEDALPEKAPDGSAVPQDAPAPPPEIR